VFALRGLPAIAAAGITPRSTPATSPALISTIRTSARWTLDDLQWTDGVERRHPIENEKRDLHGGVLPFSRQGT
jgi:hypothetical protein